MRRSFGSAQDDRVVHCSGICFICGKENGSVLFLKFRNPAGSKRIQEDFCQLGDILKALSFEEEKAVSSVVCDLCLAHEQTGFYHGISVGMHLMTEVSGLQ